MAMPRLLSTAAQPLADRLRQAEQPVRLIGHYDCDGLTSSAILARALQRCGLRFHLTNVVALTPDVIDQLNSEVPALVLFSDLGSGYPDLLAQLKTSALVVDHHLPQGETPPNVLELNAHKAGIDGNREASAASLAFALALILDEANRDLAPVALAGAWGDRMYLDGLVGWNRMIADMAVEDKYLNNINRLPLTGETLADALASSLEPYLLGVSGNPAATAEVLQDLGFDPAFALGELDVEGTALLADWLALKLLEQGAGKQQRTQLFAPQLDLPRWGCSVEELAAMTDACGRLDDTSTGIAMLLGSPSGRERAEAYVREHREQLLEQLACVEFERGRAIQHFRGDNAALKGTICTLALGYFLDRSLPAIGLAPRDGKLIASSRAAPQLVAQGLSLAEVMAQAASACGGQGGGHAQAAGASLPLEKGDEFIDEVDQLVAERLGL